MAEAALRLGPALGTALLVEQQYPGPQALLLALAQAVLQWELVPEQALQPQLALGTAQQTKHQFPGIQAQEAAAAVVLMLALQEAVWAGKLASELAPELVPKPSPALETAQQAKHRCPGTQAL